MPEAARTELSVEGSVAGGNCKRAIVDGRELIEPFPGASDSFQEFYVDLQAVPRAAASRIDARDGPWIGASD